MMRVLCIAISATLVHACGSYSFAVRPGDELAAPIGAIMCFAPEDFGAIEHAPIDLRHAVLEKLGSDNKCFAVTAEDDELRVVSLQQCQLLLSGRLERSCKEDVVHVRVYTPDGQSAELYALGLVPAELDLP